MDRPLQFKPYLRPLVWGGRRLGETLGKPLPSDEAYGESWEISDHPHHRSQLASGPLAGHTLRHLMEQRADALLGPASFRHPQFPWLIKFLDANDWLSVQVHPDETSVQRLWPGEGSKTEAWFVLHATPTSRIFAGLKPGVDEATVRAALAAGTVADCLHSFTPQAGDCVFLPAGTVHAVGGGVLLAEIQQTSDATFRLFDWDRRDATGKMRQLHLEEALASTHWDRGPVHPRQAAGFSGNGAPTRLQRQELVRCPYFLLEYCQAAEPLPWGGEGRLQAIVVLEGRATIRNADGSIDEVEKGQTRLLPASSPPVWCTPAPLLKFLLCTLP